MTGVKNKIIEVPTIKEPITRSPGFAKKLLADFKLDLLALCGFGCIYCSSNAGFYLRIHREEFADLTEQQADRKLWSRYATDLYLRLRDHARRNGWLKKLRFLLYEDQITSADALDYAGFDGVLLQSKPGDDGRSRNPYIAAMQSARNTTP